MFNVFSRAFNFFLRWQNPPPFGGQKLLAFVSNCFPKRLSVKHLSVLFRG